MGIRRRARWSAEPMQGWHFDFHIHVVLSWMHWWILFEESEKDMNKKFQRGKTKKTIRTKNCWKRWVKEVFGNVSISLDLLCEWETNINAETIEITRALKSKFKIINTNFISETGRWWTSPCNFIWHAIF